MSDHVLVDPDVLLAAAAELEALAARLGSTVSAAAPALRVAPAGSEEVSTLVAGYFHRLADSLGPAAARGLEELVSAAAALRAQAAAYRNGDHDLAAALAVDG